MNQYILKKNTLIHKAPFYNSDLALPTLSV